MKTNIYMKVKFFINVIITLTVFCCLVLFLSEAFNLGFKDKLYSFMCQKIQALEEPGLTAEQFEQKELSRGWVMFKPDGKAVIVRKKIKRCKSDEKNQIVDPAGNIIAELENKNI